VALDLTVHRNIGDAFAQQVASRPECAAVTIFGGSATDDDTVTFAELARRAQWRAAGLASLLAPGDRVLIALPTCTEFIELYLACLFAGMVAVPVPPPGRSANAVERVAAVIADCAPALAFATSGDRPRLTEWLRDHELAHVPVEEPGDVGSGQAPGLPSLARRPDHDTLAVLQYSSGSTGAPNGVMLAHGDILANMTVFGADHDFGPDDVFGAWLPLHHDMGLFAQLTAALFFGARAILMQPTEFVRRPIEWLRMMDRFGATVTAAPDFAYSLCQRVIPEGQIDGLDLSRLRVAFNGSEPIHVPTMSAFVERFARAGLRPEAMSPAYGLAECTVYVASKPLGELPAVIVADPRHTESVEHPALRATSGGDGKALAGVRRPAGVRTRIVDPRTCRGLPDGAIGEIWLSGPGIGRGYWNQPERSESVFAARLADDDDDAAGWLRTGDLGAFVGDGLFITGRIKEMLIVRGRNIFPHDLEQEARATHTALAGFVGAAFGIAAPDERFVLIHEIGPRVAAEELPAVAAAITRRLTAAVGAPVRNILLVRRGTVRRTTSGKIQRGATRARFLAGDIEPLYADLEPSVRAVVGVRGG